MVGQLGKLAGTGGTSGDKFLIATQTIQIGMPVMWLRNCCIVCAAKSIFNSCDQPPDVQNLHMGPYVQPFKL